ncbi:MAG: L-seryl-tRNA(Sec) selenium transferase [Deltaproteobacteria bacterium]|nr:L-seryl-tRNA(Sec) selenium transferase [Deltaproteobacteria bacterium]MBW2151075.1 L-seryl-tRNA(Sec) selenium transferase [Deltaproteobacteria bacterium]
MEPGRTSHCLLRKLPGVDHILEIAKKDPFFAHIPRTVLVRSIRSIIEDLREIILKQSQSISQETLSDEHVLNSVKEHVKQLLTPNLRSLINATGIVVHTNLGRSLLASEALDHLAKIGGRYSNLEYDLAAGGRGSRYSAVEDILCELCGSQAAMVVNNNAAAVLLCLETIAKGKEVIISRGELVEIGGSFRIPDVMEKSGGILREVGTTNRTHLKDYEDAIGNDTALILKVHRSNYSVVGFTSEVSLKELVRLGEKYHIPVMEDLGSGTLIDFSKYGLLQEPTVQESVGTGADVVTFSGDKLLGGPQAGIIAGKKEIIEKINKNPLTRALRIDKLTLAALEITLRLYRDERKAISAIPTLRLLTLSSESIELRAKDLQNRLEAIDDPRLHLIRMDCASRSGGGALPLLDLPSKCIGVTVNGMSANEIESAMRENQPPIIGRIENDRFVMDLRTVQEDEITIIQSAFENMLKGIGT